MDIWRTLSPDEEASFGQWARENYTPGTLVNPLWHPVVREECERMNAAIHYHVIPDVLDPLPDQTGMAVYYETEQDATDAANDERHPHHVISCTDPACKE